MKHHAKCIRNIGWWQNRIAISSEWEGLKTQREVEIIVSLDDIRNIIISWSDDNLRLCNFDQNPLIPGELWGQCQQSSFTQSLGYHLCGSALSWVIISRWLVKWPDKTKNQSNKTLYKASYHQSLDPCVVNSIVEWFQDHNVCWSCYTSKHVAEQDHDILVTIQRGHNLLDSFWPVGISVVCFIIYTTSRVWFSSEYQAFASLIGDSVCSHSTRLMFLHNYDLAIIDLQSYAPHYPMVLTTLLPFSFMFRLHVSSLK